MLKGTPSSFSFSRFFFYFSTIRHLLSFTFSLHPVRDRYLLRRNVELGQDIVSNRAWWQPRNENETKKLNEEENIW